MWGGGGPQAAQVGQEAGAPLQTSRRGPTDLSPMVRLAVLMATEEKPYETFLEKSFSLFDPELGDER